MNSFGRRLIVIGTSSGGLFALRQIAHDLPPRFPAALVVVQHMSADATGALLVDALAKAGRLPVKLAVDGEPIRSGHIYVAPPDNHTLIGRNKIIVSKGARENRSRPAIDPLF